MSSAPVALSTSTEPSLAPAPPSDDRERVSPAAPTAASQRSTRPRWARAASQLAWEMYARAAGLQAMRLAQSIPPTPVSAVVTNPIALPPLPFLWMADDAQEECAVCGVEFSFFNRRHHVREGE